MIRKILVFVFLLSTQLSITAQVLKLDQLEMRYDQEQYRNVYRKANRLLNDPTYDFSFIPKYYVALSSLQLAQNERWRRRNKNVFKDVKETFNKLNQNFEGQEVLRSHQYELSKLKRDLTSWLEKLNSEGDKKTFKEVQELMNVIFKNAPNIIESEESYIKSSQSELKEYDKVDFSDMTKRKATEETYLASTQRENILEISKELLGVPYKWAGTTPQGFDCSGFTCYVIEKGTDKSLSHRAADQYKEAKKIKQKNAKPGDLIFFSNGSKIFHVGIIFSTNNNSIQMVHSSSSVGVSIIDIFQSAYWKKHIAGFGTFFND